MSAVTQQDALGALHCLGDGNGRHDSEYMETLRQFIAERDDLTLRDQLAIALLPILKVDVRAMPAPPTDADFTSAAYRFADVMLIERAK